MSVRTTSGKVIRLAAVALTVAAVSPLTATVADARVGGGFSTGSRGLKTFSKPPSTRTAPGAAQPMQRSAQPSTQTVGAATAARPQSRFGGGFLGGLLGAGLLGALFGFGFFHIGGLLGFLGMLLQFALLAAAGFWLYGLFARRNAPATASGPGGYQRTALNDTPRGGTGGAASSPAGPSGIGASATKQINIGPADFASFERLLSVIQLAYGREDETALRSAVTEEMLGYFGEQVQENMRKGVRNELGAPKLLSGDLSEAWSEPSGEYATVAMRYELTDAMVDRNSGRVVSGSTTSPDTVTELWTFVRRAGGGSNSWRLSAIQQTA